MSSKRAISQQSNKENLSQSKRSRTADTNNSLKICLRESGLSLKHPPEKCIATEEIIHIVRNIKKNLQKHYDYPRNVSEIFSNLEKECLDLNIFKHYLFPNIVKISGDSLEEHAITDSVMKVLLSIPILQNKLIDYIFEKAIDLATDSKCGPWIQMILKCFSTLDNIVDSEKMSTHLINLLDITSEKMVKLEIITAVPDIIGDQEHANVAAEMSRILSEDHDLIPAILDCLSYLCLSNEQYELLQKKTLSILMGLSKCCYFPNFVKFLLMPGCLSENGCLEAIQGLRNSLSWPSISNPQEIASSQVLTSTAMRNSMVSSKVIASAWLKVVSNCKVSADHKRIDIVILLILFSASEEKQKQVENLIRKQIKLEILKEDLLDDAFQKYKPILKEYLKQLIELNNMLLKTKSDPEVEMFASHIYMLMFSELDECCPTIVAELLQLSLDSKQSVMSILQILNSVASKDMSLLKPQCLQMLTLLDRMDDMPLNEVRAVMDLLCGLSYSYENSVIRDDIHMIIRKELSSSNPKIKVQGILAGIHAVKYLMASTSSDDESRELPDDISYSSVAYLSEGDLREAAQIIELICRSTRQFPDMIAFFYDELSQVILSAPHINKHFMSWLTDAVTNDLQQNFISDSIENVDINGMKLSMQFCLNADSEMDEVIAINIAGLALQANSEVSVGILSSLFQLVQTLHSRQHEGNLSSIDALLGCAVVMPLYNIDLIDDMDDNTVSKILDCLVYCVNWFIELLNGFAAQEDEALRGKTLQRVVQIEELETIIAEILLKTGISYKPPISTFNISKYTGEHMNRKVKPPSSSKQKQQKRNGPDDTAIPETAKSQATQNHISIKNRLESLHGIPLRHLNLNLLKLCCSDLSENRDSDSDLTVNTLKFLVKCINSKLETILVSKIKRKTFLTKQETTIYDPVKAEECAKLVSEVLPQFMNHIKSVTAFIDKQISLNNTQNESGFVYTSELIEYLTCLEHIYQFLTIYFKWIGFKSQHHALLKSSLRTLAQADKPVISLKDLILTVAKNLQSHEKYCLQLTTAVSLIELLKSIQIYSDIKTTLKILKDMAHNFLSQQWKTPDGIPEKGLFYNQSVDKLAGIYLVNSEILALKTLTLQLTLDIKSLNTRNDTLNTLKCVNKSNFTILFRNLGTALHDATKTCLNKGLTNSEHLGLWKDVASIMKHMSDIAKTLETRNNLSAFFKKSLPVIKLFLSQGIPILDMQFKNETQEVLEILKILQQSTRFLQSLCCHSRLKKDSVLMSKVPFMRQLLETLIYKVKAALAANNCSEAFWMGNLKNKDIHGEVIASQQSVGSEESVEDGDEHLPEEDDDDSDEEMINPESKSLSDIV